MKSKQLLGSALVALAISALFAQSAKATGGNNDLYLGFTDGTNANDYLVDVGTISSILSATTPISLNLNADLGSSSLFGSNYYTGDTSLTFGLYGYTGNLNNTTNVLLSEDSVIGLTDAPTGSGKPQSGADAAAMHATVTGFNDAAAAGSTPNPTFGVFSSNVSNAVIQPATEDAAGNAYAVENPTVNAFGSGYPITTAIDGGTLDLFEAPQAYGANPTLIGTATVSSGGVFTFTPEAVPEPSTYALMALGLGALGFRLRRLSA